MSPVQAKAQPLCEPQVVERQAGGPKFKPQSVLTKIKNGSIFCRDQVTHTCDSSVCVLCVSEKERGERGVGRCVCGTDRQTP